MPTPIRIIRRGSPAGAEKPLLLDARLAEHTTMAEVVYAMREGLAVVRLDEQAPPEPTPQSRGQKRKQRKPPQED